MLSVEEAQARIVSHARLTEPERVGLDAAVGRVPVSATLLAPIDVPPFANSAMDGFAVRVDELPAELPVSLDVPAGAPMPGPLPPGSVARIMTGAPIPPGADAVVPIEQAIVDDGLVRIDSVPASGQNLRAAGHDTHAGEEVVLPAAPLTSIAIGVLASLGVGEVEVRRRPRVAILSTGDELVDPGAPLREGQIYDANSWALAAAVAEAGGESMRLGRVPDDAAATQEQLQRAASAAELVVVSGGVSVGDRDHVRTALERLGKLDFWRIRVQPGKPLAFGEIEGRPVIGLPGNPVSALVTFELFVRPLIRASLGLDGDGRLRVRAVATERIGKDPDRRAYLRVVVTAEEGGYAARPAGGQASSQLRALAAANALLLVPEGEEAARPGEAYEAILLGNVA